MSMLGRGFAIVKRGIFATRSLSKSSLENESRRIKQIPESAIEKSVFISQSTDIHTNLALEDWFYRNYDFSNHHVLLLWKNDPCVVIGRHQNPWLESNVGAAEERGIVLARRNSGGGTVYHDSGNVNLTFFTPKERYNRRYNLEIMTRALYREWGLKTKINERDDIVVEGDLKVSGTAAKLGRPNAYHHCTLLVGVDKSSLRLALERKENEMETTATQSVRSPVKNLTDINSQIRTDKLMNAVGWEYLRTKALTLEDGGHDLVEKQKGFQLINPTEDWFPGLEKLKDDFKSWDWIFGRSPNFTITRTIEVSSDNGNLHSLKLILDVKKGIVEDVKISLPENFAPWNVDQDASVITNLRGSRYNHEITERIIGAMGCKTVAIDAAKNVNKSNVAVNL